MAAAPLQEQDAVHDRVEEVRVEMEGFHEAPRGAVLVPEAQQGGALVAPRGRVLGPEGQSLVVTGHGSAVVLRLVERGALVHPRLDEAGVQLQEGVVRLDLLLDPAETMERRGEGHPPLVRFAVRAERLRKALQRAVVILHPPQDGAAREPRRVVLRLELEGEVEPLEGLVQSAGVEGAHPRAHRPLEAVDAGQVAVLRVVRGADHGAFPRSRRRRTALRHRDAMSWRGSTRRASTYAARASSYRARFWRATPFPVHASAL